MTKLLTDCGSNAATAHRFLESTRRDGLECRARQVVHLSLDIHTAAAGVGAAQVRSLTTPQPLTRFTALTASLKIMARAALFLVVICSGMLLPVSGGLANTVFPRFFTEPVEFKSTDLRLVTLHFTDRWASSSGWTSDCHAATSHEPRLTPEAATTCRTAFAAATSTSLCASRQTSPRPSGHRGLLL